jgi:hypothetical protein
VEERTLRPFYPFTTPRRNQRRSHSCPLFSFSRSCKPHPSSQKYSIIISLVTSDDSFLSHFASNTVSQRHRSAQPLLTLDSPSAHAYSVTSLPSLPVTDFTLPSVALVVQATAPVRWITCHIIIPDRFWVSPAGDSPYHLCILSRNDARPYTPIAYDRSRYW